MVRLGDWIIECNYADDIDFNSSMVRLGGGRLRQVAVFLTNFNSSMVRLGDKAVFRYKTADGNFNSSMVRLGGVYAEFLLFPDVLFQFQYGTIGGPLI